MKKYLRERFGIRDYDGQGDKQVIYNKLLEEIEKHD